jgi:hypothetical protein
MDEGMRVTLYPLYTPRNFLLYLLATEPGVFQSPCGCLEKEKTCCFFREPNHEASEFEPAVY